MPVPAKVTEEEDIKQFKAYLDARTRNSKEYVEQFKQRQKAWLEQSGLSLNGPLPGPKTYRIEDQYAVLVGGYKDDDAAFKAAQQIRKLPPPSEKFMDQAMQGVVNGDQLTPVSEKPVYINPFRTAFAVRNPRRAPVTMS